MAERVRSRWGAAAWWLVAVVAVIRAGAWATYSAATWGLPFEAYHLEAKMVHLAWRWQHGLSVYPDWTAGPPYVCNFFGPVGFVVVGEMGRWLDSSLDGLFQVGRLVTLAAAVAGAALVGGAAGSRYGHRAGWLAGLLAVGSAPDVGFSVMTRPDLLADALGLGGFLLCTGRERGRAAAATGGALLVAAMLTKQTAVLYLLAAVAGLGLTGRRRRGLGVLAGCLAGLGLLVGLGTLLWEPRLAVDLLGESGMAWDVGGWLTLVERAVRLAPDLVVLGLAGLWVWTRPEPRGDRVLAALAVVAAVVPVVAMGKHGADLNYLLPWRGVAALGAAAWLTSSRPEPGAGLGRRLGRLVVVGAMVVSLAWSGWLMVGHAQQALAVRTALISPPGRSLVRTVRAIYNEAITSPSPVLTDDGLLDIRQGARALFADPWLFRVMVNDGRIEPEALVEAIEAQRFGRVITRHDLFAETYADYEFGLPMVLVDRLRAGYEPEGVAAGMYLYVRRPRLEPRGTGR